MLHATLLDVQNARRRVVLGVNGFCAAIIHDSSHQACQTGKSFLVNSLSSEKPGFETGMVRFGLRRASLSCFCANGSPINSRRSTHLSSLREGVPRVLEALPTTLTSAVTNVTGGWRTLDELRRIWVPHPYGFQG